MRIYNHFELRSLTKDQGIHQSRIGMVLRSGLIFSLFALFSSPASFAGVDSGEYDFVGVAKCKTCHKKDGIGNQHGSWLDTKHAKAFETLAGDQAKTWGAEAGVDDPQTDEKCVKCHVTAYGVPADRLGSKVVHSDGVGCESCHGAGKKYRKKKVMIDFELAQSKGLVPQSAEVCVTCHNDESPAWDAERYTLKDGSKAGFDYEQAVAKIRHDVPEGYDPLGEGEAD